MRILAGVLGLLQCTILPGWLLLRLIRLRGGILEKVLYLFPLSLTVNYLLVWLLVGLRIYSAPVLAVCIAAEIFVLIVLYRQNLSRSTSELWKACFLRVKNELSPVESLLHGGFSTGKAFLSTLLWITSACLALSALFWSFHLLRLKVGAVFSGWDVVFSWNIFAETWADGRIPLIEGLYPQLLPANWSVSYVLLGGTELQLFNTLLPPLFFIWILTMFFDLGVQQKQSAWFLAAVLSRYMMKKLMGDQLTDGYMDVPAACMALLTVYTCLKARDSFGTDRRSKILLAYFFACASAVTKQSGAVALVLFPVFWLCWLRSETDKFTRKEKSLFVFFPLLIVLPWYLYCLVRVPAAQVGGSEVIAEGIVSFNRQYELSHKILLARQGLGRYVLVLVFSVIGLPLLPKDYRLPLALLIIPLTFLWVGYYSYDTRNICVALPFVAISCGWAAERLWDRLLSLMGYLRIGVLPFAVWLVFAAVLLGTALLKFFPDERLLQAQRSEQKKLFGEQLNQDLLYGVFGETHEGKDILTDYPANFLSGYEDCCSAIDFANPEHFSQALADPSIHYLLKPLTFPAGAEETSIRFEMARFDGSLTEIGCSNGYYIPYCLYQIEERP